MDITAHNFKFFLPKILEDLANCSFVSLDFEFSGIAGASLGRSGRPQTLQQRYEEVKQSANTYQILQVGLTVCHEDTQAAMYTLKPYNLYLSPIIDRRLEVERNWSFQSSAIEFILENKFSMDSLFHDGVTYLSREEEQQAISRVIERQNQSTGRKSLDVKEDEHESIAFLQLTRCMINKWLALGNKRDNYLNIPPPSREIETQGLKSMPTVLNRFQKRLVHQLVEVEYPRLVTIGKPSFVQIIEYDEKREKAIREQKVKWVQERAWKQAGFRWVAEALVGGDLTNLEPQSLAGIKATSTVAAQSSSIKDFSNDFKRHLKTHRPILVGHNLFTDLIYFCRCFFGPLPDRVEEFQAMAYELFPVLIDTKYLATHNCGSINPRSSLQEINDSLSRIPTPAIRIHPEHTKYRTQKIDHEAGYDSLLTAQVFIKLSAQLCEEQASMSLSTNAVLPTDQEKESLPKQTSPRAPRSSKRGHLDSRSGVLGVEAARDAIGMINISKVPQDQAKEGQSKQKQTPHSGNLIPRADSVFWKFYGNKLRVFGTEEKVCTVP